MSLEGSKVQCLGFTANGIDIETQSGFIHITGNYYLHIIHIRDVLPLLKMKEVFFWHNFCIVKDKWEKFTV